MVDTVLVVADSAEYDAGAARAALADSASEAFLEVTAGPIADNEEASFRLYRGATPRDPVDGMFSFFPATPAEGDSGFPRPVIELPGEYFNPGKLAGPERALAASAPLTSCAGCGSRWSNTSIATGSCSVRMRSRRRGARRSRVRSSPDSSDTAPVSGRSGGWRVARAQLQSSEGAA